MLSQANPTENLLNDCSLFAAFCSCKGFISSLDMIYEVDQTWTSMSSCDEFHSSEMPHDLHFIIVKTQRSSLEEKVWCVREVNKKCVGLKTYLKCQRGRFTLQLYGPTVRHRGQRRSRACCERLAALGELITSSASLVSPRVMKVTQTILRLSTNTGSEIMEMDHCI